jgi:hypothetical protein
MGQKQNQENFLKEDKDFDFGAAFGNIAEDVLRGWMTYDS